MGDLSLAGRFYQDSIICPLIAPFRQSQELIETPRIISSAMIVKNIIATMCKQSFHLVRRNREGSIKKHILQTGKKYPHQQRRTLILSCCTAYSMQGNIGHLNRQHIPLRRQRKDTFLMPGESRTVRCHRESSVKGCRKQTGLRASCAYLMHMI